MQIYYYKAVDNNFERLMSLQIVAQQRQVVSRSQTLYFPLPATRGGKGLAHSNIASGSELHRIAEGRGGN